MSVATAMGGRNLSLGASRPQRRIACSAAAEPWAVRANVGKQLARREMLSASNAVGFAAPPSPAPSTPSNRPAAPAQPPTLTLHTEAEACCCGMDFNQTVRYLSNTRQVPGIVRLHSPAELATLRALGAEMDLAVIVTMHAGSEQDTSKPRVHEFHKNLNALYTSQLACTNALFVKVELPTTLLSSRSSWASISSMSSACASMDAVDAAASDAWQGYRLPDGSPVLRSFTTFAECKSAGVFLTTESAQLNDVRQLISDALFRSKSPHCL